MGSFSTSDRPSLVTISSDRDRFPSLLVRNYQQRWQLQLQQDLRNAAINGVFL